MRIVPPLGLAILLTAACSGDDPPAGDGSGGGGAGSSTGGVLPDTSQGAGGGTALEGCDRYCGEVDAAGCTPAPGVTCEAYCENRVDFAQACESLLAPVIECEADQIAADGCESSGPCDDLRDTFLACVYPPDGPGDITCELAPEEVRICETSSSEHTFTSHCSRRDDDLGFDCSCRIDGESFGTCIDVSDAGTCCYIWFQEAP